MKKTLLTIIISLIAFTLLPAENNDMNKIEKIVQILDYSQNALSFDYDDGSFEFYDCVTLLFIDKNIEADFYIAKFPHDTADDTDIWKSINKKLTISLSEEFMQEIDKKDPSIHLFISELQIIK